MKPPRKSSLLHRVVVHLLYKHRKEKTIQTEDERSLTQAFPKRIIYLFDRYSVSKKSVCGGLFRQNTFPLLANIGVLRAGRAQPLYLLTPLGRFGPFGAKCPQGTRFLSAHLRVALGLRLNSPQG